MKLQKTDMVFPDTKSLNLLKGAACILVLAAAILACGCTSEEGEFPHPEGATVGELLANPEYDTPVYVKGTISDLGMLNCQCFHLTSGGKTICVWYNMMVEDDRTSWPAVDISGLSNGEEVVLYGELKSEGDYRQKNDFWLIKIE